MGISEKKLRELILPTLKDAIQRLSIELEQRGFIAFSTNDVSNNGEQFQENFNDFRNNFYVFKSLVRQIHATSELSKSRESQSLGIFEILEILNKSNIFHPDWIKNNEVSDVINSNETISQDAENAKYIYKIFENNNIDIASEINALLLGYTKSKVANFFTLTDYKSKVGGIDLSTRHYSIERGLVLFQIKYNREKSYTPEREHIFQLCENLKIVDDQFKSKSSQIALVSYSTIPVEQFDSVIFKFKQFAKQLDIESSFLNRINLIPANLMAPISVEAGINKFHVKLGYKVSD